jgi:uncharacterized protein
MTDERPEVPFARERTFEWDENKRRSNVEKHSIDFADAKDVFDDPAARTYASPRSEAERRYMTVGKVGRTVMAVVFTLRGLVIRIISARAASRDERQRYGSQD